MKIIQSLLSLRKQTDFYPNLLSIFYHTSFFSRRGLVKGVKKFSTHLSGKLLDFGCGAKPYQKFFSVDEYIGVDIAVSGHSHAESKVDIFYDGQSIPIEDGYFDSCFSSEVFEHIFNLPEILKEINRVLKCGGKILLTIPFAVPEHEVPYDFARYTSFGIKDLLQKNGFKVLEIQKSNHFIEMIFQLIVWYNVTLLYRKNKILTFLQLLILVAPFNILGLFFSNIMPKRDTHYNNLIILAEKHGIDY